MSKLLKQLVQLIGESGIMIRMTPDEEGGVSILLSPSSRMEVDIVEGKKPRKKKEEISDEDHNKGVADMLIANTRKLLKKRQFLEVKQLLEDLAKSQLNEDQKLEASKLQVDFLEAIKTDEPKEKRSRKVADKGEPVKEGAATVTSKLHKKIYGDNDSIKSEFNPKGKNESIPSQSPEIDALITLANTYAYETNYAAAIDKLLKAEKIDPKNEAVKKALYDTRMAKMQAAMENENGADLPEKKVMPPNPNAEQNAKTAYENLKGITDDEVEESEYVPESDAEQGNDDEIETFE